MTSGKPFSFSLKVVVLNDRDECLVLQRSANSKGNPGKWEFPGGKLEPGESFDQGLLREVFEETALTVTLRHVLGAAESELPDRIVAYLILEAEAQPGTVYLSDEHDSYEWIPLGKLPGIDLAAQFKPFARHYAGPHE